MTANERREEAVTEDLDKTLIAMELLTVLEERVAKIKDRTRRREVEGVLRPLARAIVRWATVPPTDEQTKTLFDLLLRIQDEMPTANQP